MVFTVYGLMAAVAAWASVVAEIITPKSHDDRVYSLDCHACLIYGIWSRYELLYLDAVILWYSWAGLSIVYLFIYDDAGASHPSSASCCGYGLVLGDVLVGIGVIGSYLPSFSIPMMGETEHYGWLSVWVAIGGAIAYFSLRNIPVDRSKVIYP